MHTHVHILYTHNVSAFLCSVYTVLSVCCFVCVQGGNANVLLLLKRNSEVTLTLS